jgi:choline dehydrogenase-like flavoprotein
MTSHCVVESNEDFQFVAFDFVIVGGGTAGLVLAARLSEGPKVKVAVLETGKSRKGDENVESIAGMHATLNNPEYDWAFKTVPQVWQISLTCHPSMQDQTVQLTSAETQCE